MEDRLKRITALATASGILMSSCDNYNLDNNVYGNFAENKAHGVDFLNIENSNLSESFFRHAQIFAEIISDMVNDKELADLFCENPDEYLKIKNISLDFQVTEEQRMLIEAFTDKEVQNVIRENNLRDFISICKKKGYIKINSKERNINDYSIYFKNEDEFKKFEKYVQENGGDELISTMAAIPAAVVAIGSVAVALYAVAGVSAGLGVNVAYAMDFWIGPGEAEPTQALTKLSNKEPVIKLWLNSTDSKLDYDLIRTGIIDERVEEIMEIFYENYDGDDVNLEKLKELIKINLEGAYGVRR